MASSDHLVPGEKGEIKVKVSTKGKRGRLSKNIFIFSNDPQKPAVTLTLVVNVKDPYHTRKYPPQEIFKKPCAECHAERGRGKTGGALFNSVCLICHRAEKSQTNLATFRSLAEDALRSAIYSGVPNRSMPAFSWKEGGSLSDEDIDSVIRYIKNR